MSKQLTVCGVAINQDAEGRYCLNDLHKASGGNPKHKPAEWKRYSTAKELLEELKVGNPTFNPMDTEKGRNGGTFVVKELVYAYAMWISPKFHLEVIRSYDRLATDGVAVHYTAAEDVLDDPLSFMEKIISQAKVLKAERDRLALENQELAPKATVFDNCMAPREESLHVFMRSFEGVNTMNIKCDLKRLGYLYRCGKKGKYRVYSKYRDKLFVERMAIHPTHPTYEIFPTEKGKELLAKLYKEGKLTMKTKYTA